MIDAFESRLADLLADATSGAAAVAGVSRLRDGLTDAPAGKARVTVQLISGAPSTELGDDRLESIDKLSQRPVLRLSGEAEIAVEVATQAAPADQAGERGVLLRALDAVLLALHDATVRDGTKFATNVDQGFELDGFRLEGLQPDAQQLTNFRRLTVRYAWSGRFWPATAPIAGPAIAKVPTRVAVLPLTAPATVEVHAGAAPLSVAMALDLRGWQAGAAGAPPPARAAARLMGASPPGALVGDATGLPAGWIGFAVDAAGNFTLVYQPPATLAARADVRVEIGLAAPDHETAPLGELRITVRP